MNKEKLIARLNAQKQEANTLGLHKIADFIENGVQKIADSNYVPKSYSELRQIIMDNTFESMIAIAHYFGTFDVDSSKLFYLADNIVHNLIQDTKNVLNVNSAFGPNEPTLPGEEMRMLKTLDPIEEPNTKPEPKPVNIVVEE